ncbi:uncharacterized protein [Pseudorca crassidens]|uniref:uncharacterized protein n=1 Tax=Pseudorca crassidens TaxID=82174 RepID=UPI00352FDC37
MEQPLNTNTITIIGEMEGQTLVRVLTVEEIWETCKENRRKRTKEEQSERQRAGEGGSAVLAGGLRQQPCPLGVRAPPLVAPRVGSVGGRARVSETPARVVAPCSSSGPPPARQRLRQPPPRPNLTEVGVLSACPLQPAGGEPRPAIPGPRPLSVLAMRKVGAGGGSSAGLSALLAGGGFTILQIPGTCGGGSCWFLWYQSPDPGDPLTRRREDGLLPSRSLPERGAMSRSRWSGSSRPWGLRAAGA